MDANGTQLELMPTETGDEKPQKESITTIEPGVLWDRLDQRQAEGRELKKALEAVERFFQGVERRMEGLRDEHLECKKEIVESHGAYLPLSLRLESKKGTLSRALTWSATHFKRFRSGGKSSKYHTRIRMHSTKDQADPVQLGKHTTRACPIFCV